MGKISPGPTRWPAGAERRLVLETSNLKPQTSKNGIADYISCNIFDALLGESLELLAKEAFQRMDVQVDLSMRTAGVREGWSLKDYQSEYQCILKFLSDGLEAPDRRGPLV